MSAPASGTQILIDLIDGYREEISGLRAELAASREETRAALLSLQEGQRHHRERSEPLLREIEKLTRAEAARAERPSASDRFADALIPALTQTLLPVLIDWRVVVAAILALAAAAGLEIGDTLRAILSSGVAP